MENRHMNDQQPAELQRTDEYSQTEPQPGTQVEVAPPKGLTKERLMAGASVTAIVPRSFEEVWRIAQLAVKSGLAPRDIKTPERAAIAIMHGLEIGLPPMAALQRIAVINGRPCVWGDAVPGIALSTGQLRGWHERFDGVGDDLTAVCAVERRMGDTTMTKEGRFSVADAKKADLWDERAKVKRKNYQTGEMYETANDSPWYCYPKRMLQMRARVAFRDLFADAMCGLYIAEELVGRDSDSQMRDVTPQYERIANPLGGDDVGPPSVAAKSNIAQEAPGNAAGASEAESGGGQPSEAKSHHGPDGEAGDGNKSKRKAKPKSETRPDGGTVAEGHPGTAGSGKDEGTSGASAPPRSDPSSVTFPPPWNRKSPADYAAYARTWIGMMTDKADARARWDSERSMRNNLANAMPPEANKELQEMLGKIGP